MTRRIAIVELTGPLEAAKSHARVRGLAAWKSGKFQGEVFGFETPERLWKLLTPRRWELLQALQEVGAMSLRSAARRVSREVKAVHRDVQALLAIGLLKKTGAGKLVCPFAEIKVNLVLRLKSPRSTRYSSR